MRGGVRRLKQINGWLYAGGGLRSLCKRVDRNHWEEIGPLSPQPRGEGGFNDFDAFSEVDIYAAGGTGHGVTLEVNGWR